MRAADVMSRPVLTVRADDTVDQVAALLTGGQITAAPVVDAQDDLVGIVSEGDLLRAHTRAGQAPHLVVVAEVMTKDVVTMPPDADLSAIAEAMLAHNVHSVPIVDDVGQLCGMVSRLDLLRAYVRTDDTVQLDAQHRLDEYAAGERIWSVAVADGVAEIAGEYSDEAERQVVEILVRTVPGVSRVTRPA